MQKIIVGLIVFLLIGGVVAGLNFAYEAELVREDRYLSEPDDLKIKRILYKEANKASRYPDFSQAEQVPDGIWDCRNSLYDGDQFWTASGPNAMFACGSLLQTYMTVCEEIKINSPGVDDECILD